jgi:hypothetical protein
MAPLGLRERARSPLVPLGAANRPIALPQGPGLFALMSGPAQLRRGGVTSAFPRPSPGRKRSVSADSGSRFVIWTAIRCTSRNADPAGSRSVTTSDSTQLRERLDGRKQIWNAEWVESSQALVADTTTCPPCPSAALEIRSPGGGLRVRSSVTACQAHSPAGNPTRSGQSPAFG